MGTDFPEIILSIRNLFFPLVPINELFTLKKSKLGNNFTFLEYAPIVVTFTFWDISSETKVHQISGILQEGWTSPPVI